MLNAIYSDKPVAAAAEPAAGKIGEGECQVHIFGAIGQRSGITHTQKKSVARPSAPTTRPSALTRSAWSSPCSWISELDFAGRALTADALLTQRNLDDFLRRRGAHFPFANLCDGFLD